ncbi:MAG TPA: bifunctional DNA primase/polymerase [Terriglobia bacterium]|nr:bifunctional DNA primase/polymerase [Terriglobia bacterium]
MLNSAIQFLVEMALRLRFAIIPIRSDKRPVLASWKEFQSLCPSQAQVELWARDQPPAWAIITGAISGVVVLDFDGDRGIATMNALGLLPHVRTGSGGFHAYFRHPGWYVATVNSKAKRELGDRYPGLDIRADGGYAIFAGRTQAGEYTWLRDMVADPLDMLPDDVIPGNCCRKNRPQLRHKVLRTSSSRMHRRKPQLS